MVMSTYVPAPSDSPDLTVVRNIIHVKESIKIALILISKGGGTYFHLGGGGGGKDKKGHCNVKKGTKHVHADNYH